MQYPRAVIVAFLMLVTGCNPFYSVEQSMVERGYRWIQRGEFEQAANTFQMVIKDYPESPLGQLGLGDALAETGRSDVAIEHYSAAIKNLGALQKASSSGNEGAPEIVGKATFSYQNQGLTFPHGVESYIYFRRGYAYQRLAIRKTTQDGNYLSKAESDFRTALKLAPDYIAAKNALDGLETK